MVRLQHTGGYETYYLHLSALGPGIRAGARVTQGQLIGRVGTTGASTGPHLDYRVRLNGTFLNPRTVHRNMPPGKPVDERYLEAFQLVRARAEWQLGGVPVVVQSTPPVQAAASHH
jgi:murein DD-endopeptidase MepM/ murein hydrolase activator NlpD